MDKNRTSGTHHAENQSCLLDLVDAIREGRPTHTPGEQVRHVVEIIEKAQLAAMTGPAQLLTSKVSSAA